jgi:hypothetical protein
MSMCLYVPLMIKPSTTPARHGETHDHVAADEVAMELSTREQVVQACRCLTVAVQTIGKIQIARSNHLDGGYSCVERLDFSHFCLTKFFNLAAKASKEVRRDAFLKLWLELAS